MEDIWPKKKIIVPAFYFNQSQQEKWFRLKLNSIQFIAMTCRMSLKSVRYCKAVLKFELVSYRGVFRTFMMEHLWWSLFAKQVNGYLIEAYLNPCQTIVMESFAEVLDSWMGLCSSSQRYSIRKISKLSGDRA